MARLLLLLLLPLALGACRTAPHPDVAICLRKAEEALQAPDWPSVRAALDEACQIDPRSVDAAIRRAETLLKAFGAIDAAEEAYLRLMGPSRARALHGLGLCALWRGEEERALDLMRSSLHDRPTPDCARDLACRLIAREDPGAEGALDLVEEVAAGSLRGDLLLAAAGRAPGPPSLPGGWAYGLERARFLEGNASEREVEAFLVSATANEEARALYRRVLSGDFRRIRNNSSAAPVR